MIGTATAVPLSILPADVRASTTYGTDINTTAYMGMGLMWQDAEAQGSGVTLTTKLQHSDALTRGSYYAYVGDADLPLNKSTSGKTSLGCSFTNSGATSVKKCTLYLKKTGTIASDKVLTLTINSDSSGPSTAVGTAGTVLANSIGSTAYEEVVFTFTTPVNLADSTTYWIVLTSNYTASDSNFINWSVDTVASGGTVSTYASETWTGVTTQCGAFFIDEYVFTDVSGAAFTAVSNTAATEYKAINLDSLKAYVRALATVAGGSATGASSVVLFGEQ